MNERRRDLDRKAAECPHQHLCPLNQIKAGTAVRIKQLAATPDISQRLRELGFCEEQQIQLLSQNDNLICLVCNVRLGISAELARSILVEPLPVRQGAV